jgi:uncharacterized protein (TIGR00299 family) protein
MNLLYCDCFSGISGDMFLAALIDAGLPLDYLSQQLARLGLPGFRGVSARRVLKGAIQATLLEFELDEAQPHPEGTEGHEDEHHEHADHEHAHGDHEHGEHEHEHGEHEHAGHEPADHEHSHPPQRNLRDITALIQASGLPQAVVNTSTAVFRRLAEAEAKVHGSRVDEVHFHEVGAVDSILDIVGAAVGLDYFQVEQVYASALPLGSGQVRTQHGLLPLPAPATLELLTAVHAPVVPSPATRELVTPTGAALLAELARFEQPAMSLQVTGTGAGRRELPWPNVLRVLLGQADPAGGEHIEIETNIDDMNPQFFGHVMARLFEAGALDVYFTPVFMKKNRPATKLSVVARRQDEHKLADLLLRETSTLGVRVQAVRRHEADRQFRRVTTRYGEVQVKLKLLEGQVVQASPEYDDCIALARQHNLPVAQVYNEALRAAGELIEDVKRET